MPLVIMEAVKGIALEIAVRRLLATPHRERHTLARALRDLVGSNEPAKPPKARRPPPKPAVARVKKHVFKSKTYDREVKYSPPIPVEHPHQHQHQPSGPSGQQIRTVIGSVGVNAKKPDT
jgi:hypothetical protein